MNILMFLAALDTFLELGVGKVLYRSMKIHMIQT